MRKKAQLFAKAAPEDPQVVSGKLFGGWWNRQVFDGCILPFGANVDKHNGNAVTNGIFVARIGAYQPASFYEFQPAGVIAAILVVDSDRTAEDFEQFRVDRRR
jgi:hypothetical protein